MREIVGEVWLVYVWCIGSGGSGSVWSGWGRGWGLDVGRLDVCMLVIFFFFQAEDGIRDLTVTGVQTCALPISSPRRTGVSRRGCGLPPTLPPRRRLRLPTGSGPAERSSRDRPRT